MLARALGVSLAVLAAVPSLSGQAPEEFAKRRATLCSKLAKGEILVLRGLETKDPRAPFRQDSNYFYLTGLTQPGGALVLRAGGEPLLFARPGSRGRSRWNAARAGLADAAARSGIEKVEPIAALDAKLAAFGDVTRVSEPKARSLIASMRRVKSPAEIAKLKRAIRITCAAQREVMRTAEPGMFEYQLQAVIEHVFRFNGASRNGFETIVGSGPNSCILHWSKNTRKIEKGDVVVMDVGGEYGMYTADVTRTIPIGGKFTKRQRAVYEVVLRANEAAIAMVAPGVEMRAISEKAREVLSEGCVELGLLEEGDRRGLRKFYYHGLGHALGLDVHDVGGLGKLEPGMVLTIEPGLYVSEEAMGFRIEDDVLVTEKGHRVLSSAAPKSVAAIEKLMAADGLRVERYRVGDGDAQE